MTGNYPLTVGIATVQTLGRWVTRYSWPSRMAYRVWERSVPRIHDQYTHCAVYIYRSLAEAKMGEHYGGSGFLCYMPFPQNTDWGELYVITNWHVVERAKTPVIRLNRKDGKVECIATESNNWFQHQDGDDIAVLPLTVEYENFKIWGLPVERFVTPQRVLDEDIGIGDDTVMIGRFVNHEGKQKNSPAVRFGNIAMMNEEKIVTDSGLPQEAFLVEVRSLPGYSGSAVLIWSPNAMNDMSLRRSGKTFEEDEAEREKEKQEKGWVLARLPNDWMKAKGPYLLGVDFCHIHRQAPVREKNGHRVSDGWFVKENTGMAGVIPAWKILEVLNQEELVAMRHQADVEITEKKNKAGASLDTSDEDIPGQDFTQQDFERALRKASRRIEPSESDAKKK